MRSKILALSRIVVAGAVLATFAVSAADVWAQKASPVLVVPASETVLDVATELPGDVKLDASRPWQLVPDDGAGSPVPVQPVAAITADGLVACEHGRLAACVPPGNDDGQPRRFRLEPAPSASSETAGGFRFDALSDASLKLSEGDRPVLVYNFGMITGQNVPKNDPRRRRACYIHPVWGLSGEVLTDDFSKDHYHHHGIYWTWPHIQIDGKEYDLWVDRGIRQQFVRWLGRQAGPVAAVLGVENGWFVGDKKVMIERVWLRAYKATETSRSLDLEFTWIPLDKPITLWGAPGKSYGGLTVRFNPPSRTDENTVITVPDGPKKADLKEARLPWADFTSKFGDGAGLSGAAVFVSPDHPDYPPTWLTRHYGPLCVGWPGVVAKTFPPGKPIRLKYRFWIHKSAVDTQDIQQAYDGYVASTKAKCVGQGSP